jgi:hypothetical protein
MSVAIRCDRCDKIVEKDGVYAQVTLQPYANGEKHGGTTKDLCHVCAGQVSSVLLADARKGGAQ